MDITSNNTNQYYYLLLFKGRCSEISLKYNDAILQKNFKSMLLTKIFLIFFTDRYGKLIYR